MKRILATTAIVALTATNAFAASHSTEETATESTMEQTESTMEQSADTMEPMAEVNGMTINASDLIGMRVYVRENDETEIADTVAEPDAEWDDIGEVGDVILSGEGEIHAVILDVGGFLGLGEKEVSTTMDELKFVTEDGSDDDYFIVYTGNRAALEEREELDRDMTRDEGWTFYGDRDADMDNADMETTEGAADMEKTEMAEEETAAMDEEMTEEAAEGELEPTVALTEEADMGDEMGYDGMTANGLIGLSVYDASEERIGEISDLLVSNDGRISEVIVDVGGFLGIGEKPVALSFDKIQLSQDEAGAVSAATGYTLEELEALETWEG